MQTVTEPMKSSPTAANVRSADGGHWYTLNGLPAYEQPKADGKGMTPTTLRHARKLNLLPSVTTILRALDKPALTAWKIEQAVLATMTTPRLPGEADDAFVYRVLHIDEVQEQEAAKARDLGTDVHQALEDAIMGRQCPDELRVFVAPVLERLAEFKANKMICEEVIVGKGYAGKLDLMIVTPIGQIVIDFKTTKKLPKESYTEHKLQLAAYAAPATNVIDTVNIYVSTAEPGRIAICNNPDWKATFDKGFKPLVDYWQWATGYAPQQ